jgi:transcriptional regulator with XRE-family HTH domain
VVRLRLGLFREEFAARFGQDEKQICWWEAGQRTPHPAIAGRVDQALRRLEGRPAEAGLESASYFDLTRWRRKTPVGVTAQPKTFGERLRDRRLKLRLSAAFVVRQPGTSRGTLYRIECGRQKATRDLERRLRTLLRMNDASGSSTPSAPLTEDDHLAGGRDAIGLEAREVAAGWPGAGPDGYGVLAGGQR